MSLLGENSPQILNLRRSSVTSASYTSAGTTIFVTPKIYCYKSQNYHCINSNFNEKHKHATTTTVEPLAMSGAWTWHVVWVWLLELYYIRKDPDPRLD